jgi:hypothetical protein
VLKVDNAGKNNNYVFSEQKSQTKSLVAQGGGTILMF